MSESVEKDAALTMTSKLAALAYAWDAGHSAGAMWDHTQHTDPAYSPHANPYRVTPPGETS